MSDEIKVVVCESKTEQKIIRAPYYVLKTAPKIIRVSYVSAHDAVKKPLRRSGKRCEKGSSPNL